MVDNDFFFFFGLTYHSLNEGDVTGVTLLQIEFADGCKTFFRLELPSLYNQLSKALQVLVSYKSISVLTN